MKRFNIYFWCFMTIGGIIMSVASIFHGYALYDLFFNICLGLFIGGIVLSSISFVLAEMSTHDQSTDHIDHIDHVDHLDHIDHIDHIDHVDHIDHMDHVDHVDHIDNVDNVEEINDSGVNEVSEATPAPFMLLLSSFLLVFGIAGIIFYYIIDDMLKFIIFFITPIVAFVVIHYISSVWKKIAKDRFYLISSTKNLIGRKGEVVLLVDERGGVIKIPSHTPMRFEKLHVKTLMPEKRFVKGDLVYVCDVRNGFLLVDDNKDLIRRR